MTNQYWSVLLETFLLFVAIDLYGREKKTHGEPCVRKHEAIASP